MSDSQRKHIYFALDQKETEELVEIWQENNHGAWTDEAFDVIKTILLERLGEIPEQGEPVEHSEDDFDEEEEAEENESPVSDRDNENDPVFYQPDKVRQLVKWINRAAISAVIVLLIVNLLELPAALKTIQSTGDIRWDFPAGMVVICISPFILVLQIIIIYFPMKALGLILKILMEMEFNSRGAKGDSV